MNTAYVLIQTEVGTAGVVVAALRELPGVSDAASVAGPYDIIVRTEAWNIDELGRLVVSRIQAVDGVGAPSPARAFPLSRPAAWREQDHRSTSACSQYRCSSAR
jgi:DNA-binding Lrp family transcriptional regulator